MSRMSRSTSFISQVWAKIVCPVVLFYGLFLVLELFVF